MKCIHCGKEFTPTTSSNLMCSEECKAARRKEYLKDYRERRRMQMGLPPKEKKSSTICTRSADCIYGATLGAGTMCDYMCKEGKSRGGGIHPNAFTSRRGSTS